MAPPKVMHKVIFVLYDAYTIYCVLRLDLYPMMYIRSAGQLPENVAHYPIPASAEAP